MTWCIIWPIIFLITLTPTKDKRLSYATPTLIIQTARLTSAWANNKLSGGKLWGFFFADVVNAKDLREFILPEFDLIRIPQWGIDAEYTKKNFHAEFLWLPILEFNKIGVRGAEFEFPYPVPEGTVFTADRK